jgi:hypothetical protein
MAAAAAAVRHRAAVCLLACCGVLLRACMHVHRALSGLAPCGLDAATGSCPCHVSQTIGRAAAGPCAACCAPVIACVPSRRGGAGAARGSRCWVVGSVQATQGGVDVSPAATELSLLRTRVLDDCHAVVPCIVMRARVRLVTAIDPHVLVQGCVVCGCVSLCVKPEFTQVFQEHPPSSDLPSSHAMQAGDMHTAPQGLVLLPPSSRLQGCGSQKNACALRPSDRPAAVQHSDLAATPYHACMRQATIPPHARCLEHGTQSPAAQTACTACARSQP